MGPLQHGPAASSSVPYSDVDAVGDSPQAIPSRPPRGGKSSYTRTDLHPTPAPGRQTRSSLAGGSQPIALPLRSKAAATDQNAGWSRPHAPFVERPLPMLSRRLLLGLPLLPPWVSPYTHTKYQQGRRLSPPCRGRGPVLPGGGGMRS